MPSDTQLQREIRTLRDAAIANTVTLPDLPREVEEAAMAMDYEEACVFMKTYGYPVEGMKDSLVELSVKRSLPRASWWFTLGRCCQRGEFTWQLNAACNRVPNPSDRAFLASVTRLLGIPVDQSPATNEHVPLQQRQQHFVWIWTESEPEVN